MYWEAKIRRAQAELDELKKGWATLQLEIGAQGHCSEIIMKAVDAQGRRIDDQLRKIHERLDRMEGIR